MGQRRRRAVRPVVSSLQQRPPNFLTETRSEDDLLVREWRLVLRGDGKSSRTLEGIPTRCANSPRSSSVAAFRRCECHRRTHPRMAERAPACLGNCVPSARWSGRGSTGIDGMAVTRDGSALRSYGTGRGPLSGARAPSRSRPNLCGSMSMQACQRRTSGWVTMCPPIFTTSGWLV